MQLKNLNPGMTVFAVVKERLAGTKVQTVRVYPVRIISISESSNTVVASWNYNRTQRYTPASWSKWRRQAPELIQGLMGSYRLSTKADKEGMS